MEDPNISESSSSIATILRRLVHGTRMISDSAFMSLDGDHA